MSPYKHDDELRQLVKTNFSQAFSDRSNPRGILDLKYRGIDFAEVFTLIELLFGGRNHAPKLI